MHEVRSPHKRVDACHALPRRRQNAPALLPPDVHIFTASKQPWVVLPAGAPAVAEYYKASELWPAESLVRRAALSGAGPKLRAAPGRS